MANQLSETLGKPVARLAYTKAETCAVLGVGPTTLWRLEKRGILIPVKHLRTLLYSVKDLERFLNTQSASK